MATVKGTDMEMSIGGNNLENIAPPTPIFNVTGARGTSQGDVSPLESSVPQTIYIRPGRMPFSLIARIACKLSWWLRNRTEYPIFKWGTYSSNEYIITGAEIDGGNEENADGTTIVKVSWKGGDTCLNNTATGNWQWIDKREREWTEGREMT